MSFKNTLMRCVILPAGDFFFQQNMMKRFSELEKLQWENTSVLQKSQQQALIELVHTAHDEVSFYKKIMDSKKILPNCIKSISDLPQLPIITKKMLRDAGLEQTTRKTVYRKFHTATSGSTGANLRVLQDSETAGRYRAALMLSMQWAGWSIGEPHLQTGMTLDRGFQKKLKDFFLSCVYVSAYDLTEKKLEFMLEKIEQKKIKHVWGYPGGLYYLALKAEVLGWNRKLSSVITWGDQLYPQYRAKLEKVFGVKVHDTYGCSEGMQIAAQCGHGDYYHIHAYDVIVEVLDEMGNACPRGIPGRIVLTRLHPGPMPFIRYDVGDMGVLAQNSVCPCGRNLPILKAIYGRVSDVIITPSGNRLIVHYFTGILEHYEEIISYQVIQTKIDEIVLKVVSESELDKSFRQRLTQDFLNHGLMDMAIRIERADENELFQNGKRRFVIGLSFSEDLGSAN